MTWKDILKEEEEEYLNPLNSTFGDYARRAGFSGVRIASDKEVKDKFGASVDEMRELALNDEIENLILEEIEKEGGALGMKNLEKFVKKYGFDKIKEVLTNMKEEKKLFRHEDGDIYTHEPEK